MRRYITMEDFQKEMEKLKDTLIPLELKKKQKELGEKMKPCSDEEHHRILRELDEERGYW